MKTSQKSKWWLDLFLLGGFILAFMMHLTGRSLHEVIGVAAGFIAAYHLITHWSWVTAVTRRLFGKTSGQSRLYYLVDFALLAGFFTILFSGAIVAHWISIPFASMRLWRSLHATVSYATLAVAALKLAIHWRWIVSTTRKVLPLPGLPQNQPLAAQPVPVSKAVIRRER